MNAQEISKDALNPLRILIIIAVLCIIGGVVQLLAPYRHDLPDMIKPALFGCITLIFHTTAYFCEQRNISWPVEGLRLVGTVAFGIGLIVFSASYDIESMFPHGFLLFCLAATCCAVAFRSKPHACLSIIAALIWIQCINLLSKMDDISAWFILTPGLIILLAILYAWRIKSQKLLAVCTGFFLLSIFVCVIDDHGGILPYYIPYLIYGSSLMIYSVGLFLERDESWKSASEIITRFASICFVVFFLLQTHHVVFFEVFNVENQVSLSPFSFTWSYLITVYLTFFIFLFLALFHRKTKISTYALIQTLILPALLLLIYLFFSCFTRYQLYLENSTDLINHAWILINILFILSMIYRITEGLRTQNDEKIVGGIVMVLLWILSFAVFVYSSIFSNGIVFLLFGVTLLFTLIYPSLKKKGHSQ